MSIEVEELIKKIPKVKIIDIRDNYTFKKGSIETSINVPYLLLVTNPELYLNRNEEYYLVCDHGRKSEYCRQELSDRGYKVISVNGGYNRYLELKRK